MSELFDDDAEDKVLVEDEIVDEEVEEILVQDIPPPACDARRRLEKLLEDKRLENELDDFLDY